MSEINRRSSAEKSNFGPADGDPLPQDDVGQQKSARAPTLPEREAKLAESDIPAKKRKTRRGKSKRKQPYLKYGRKYNKISKNKIIKPEAPHNDNQFLLEDHGMIEELDEGLKHAEEAASTSTLTRTRDSSFSVESCDEFYSSPDDEEQFLLKDFDDQYERVQTEKLSTMTKQELIQEYLSLDNRFQELATKKPQEKEYEDNIKKLEKELEKQKAEKESLQRENEMLKSKLQNRHCNTDSEDSETDSSDSCSSSSSASSSSCSSHSVSPILENDAVDYIQSNGHVSPAPASVEPV